MAAAAAFLLLGFVPFFDSIPRADAKKVLQRAPRFEFKIDPQTPEKDLLPTPPKAFRNMSPALSVDLALVPEIFFEELRRVDPKLANFEKMTDEERRKLFDQILDGKHKAMADIAHVIAKINHLNKQKNDRFIEVLTAHRPDLRGLPFLLGDACRLPRAMGRELSTAAILVRGSRDEKPAAFWANFGEQCRNEDQGFTEDQSRKSPEVALGRIAALTQMLAADPPAVQSGLIHYLSGQKQAEATRALARIAVFSPDDKLRRSAFEALKSRNPDDCNDVLRGALRYPWPAVAKQAAEAIVQLERTDLLPELVGMLDAADPRAPVATSVAGKPATVAREVARINHNRSCLLCHPPLPEADAARVMPTGAVPVPDLPLDSPSTGYRLLSPDLVVRADATYLRPDFSLMQKVADAAPWPEMQRYDFLVRTRTLTAAEEKDLKAALAKSKTPSPYREAALAALRSLTGEDLGTSAAAWRRWLDEKQRDRP